jgi:hypothetical protein
MALGFHSLEVSYDATATAPHGFKIHVDSISLKLLRGQMISKPETYRIQRARREGNSRTDLSAEEGKA